MEVIDHDRRVGQQARCADRRRVKRRPGRSRRTAPRLGTPRCAVRASRSPRHRCGPRVAPTGPGNRPGRRSRCPTGRPAPTAASPRSAPTGAFRGASRQSRAPVWVRVQSATSRHGLRTRGVRSATTGHGWRRRRPPSGPPRRSPHLSGCATARWSVPAPGPARWTR
jgi:hypothetical protein